ncbi:MAG: DUF4097 family beta strand repeat protein [Clostridia bacterium]|nr:DUF4097 family beta strand repeat protein [Clostridia bacterium]
MIEKYITNEYEIVDDFKKLQVSAVDVNLCVEQSNNDKTKIVFCCKKNRKYEFGVIDGVLTIQLQKKKWYNYLKLGFKRANIKICLPKTILEGVNVKANVGLVDVSCLNCNGQVDIKLNCGKVTVSDSKCNTFNLIGNTGSITLNNLDANDSLFVRSNTAKVFLNDCNSREFIIKTNTGNVYGKLPKNTAFNVKTNTGKIELPKAEIGSAITTTCEVKTNTGNIKF